MLIKLCFSLHLYLWIRILGPKLIRIRMDTESHHCSKSSERKTKEKGCQSSILFIRVQIFATHLTRISFYLWSILGLYLILIWRISSQYFCWIPDNRQIKPDIRPDTDRISSQPDIRYNPSLNNE